MLIDHTYFNGHLNIPYAGASDEAMIERINTFIEWHEAEFLRKLLGSDLAAEFDAGLLGSPIESKWSTLLGKIVPALSGATSATLLPSMGVTVGRGLTYDPTSGGSVAVIPPAYVGKRVVINQRGFGELEEGLDYSITGNTLTLLGNHVFSLGDRYYYSTPDVSVVSAAGGVKRSMIANYVYYHWMLNEASQTGMVGESQVKTENATRTSPEDKMVYAWNEMVDKAHGLQCWLDKNKETYPEWEGVPYGYRDAPYGAAERFKKINIFGI